MADTKHTPGLDKGKATPGPWIAKLYEPDENGIRQWGVRQSLDAPSVSVDGEALSCGFSICNVVQQDMEDVEHGIERANAALIAAAPTLQAHVDRLEAEKAELVNVLKLTDVEVCNCPVPWRHIATIIEDIRTAVAKAEPPTITNPKTGVE